MFGTNHRANCVRELSARAPFRRPRGKTRKIVPAKRAFIPRLLVCDMTYDIPTT